MPATDYGVAYDLFFRNCYASPRPIDNVRRVVDLGSNVGYSCLFWCSRYPEADVTAFEPHPAHLEAISYNLALNGFTGRVDVVAAAAGLADGAAFLSDAGSSSSLNREARGIPVPVVDLFSLVKHPVDLLKMDIEGGEYSLLADNRFGELRARVVVVEWHKRDNFEEDQAWCEQALKKWGYDTVRGVQDPPMAGLIWAFR